MNKPKPAVEVLWTDSVSGEEGWVFTSDHRRWAKRPAAQIRTVGLLDHETKDHLVIIQCEHTTQILNSIKIPKCAVLERHELRRKVGAKRQ